MANLADCNRLITELIYILKSEIKALKNGEFNEVGQTSTVKANKTAILKEQMDVLFGSGNTGDWQKIGQAKRLLAPQLAQLNSLSKESGVLLQAIFAGLKSAQDRIWILQNANTQVGAYGRGGQALTFSEEPVSREKTV